MPDTSIVAVGARLTAVRDALGWAQNVMAEALQVSYQRLGMWERGHRMIPPDVVGRLWQRTGATADYIYLGRLDGLPLELASRIRASSGQADPQRRRIR